MNAVWKFLVPGGRSVIDMPRGARVLCVAAQDDDIYLWALVDPDAPSVERTFEARGTGHLFDPAGLNYVGTAHNLAGWLVFHVFEREEAS